MSLLNKVMETLSTKIKLPPNTVKLKIDRSDNSLRISTTREEPSLQQDTGLPAWIDNELQSNLYYVYSRPHAGFTGAINNLETVERLMNKANEIIQYFLSRHSGKGYKRTNIYKYFDGRINRELSRTDRKYQEILLQVATMIRAKNTKSDIKAIRDTLDAIHGKYKRS